MLMQRVFYINLESDLNIKDIDIQKILSKKLKSKIKVFEKPHSARIVIDEAHFDENGDLENE